ncbi:MAG: CBO0543 family protein [Sporolactobacillus sp.]
MHLIIGPLYILAAVIWGKWRNWKTYYPTILFVIVWDLIYNCLLINYPMWQFIPIGPEHVILPVHTLICFYSMLTLYPAWIILFLSHFPQQNRFWRRAGYIILVAVILTVIEIFDHYLFHSISYYHHWNIGWSFILDLLMFLMISVHFRHPLAALMLSAVSLLGFLWIFQVPII